MSDHPQSRHGHHAGGEPPRKRLHQDWRLWVAVVLALVGMGVYIVSLNESVGPDGKVGPPVPAAP